MIVKITFRDLENKKFTMMFGTSYKNWFTQCEEFIQNNITWWDDKNILTCNISMVYSVEKSTSKWIGMGGLKWCDEENFQENLDGEGCHRKYKDMVFTEDKSEFYKVKYLLSHRLRHLYKGSTTDIKEAIALPIPRKV